MTTYTLIMGLSALLGVLIVTTMSKPAFGAEELHPTPIMRYDIPVWRMRLFIVLALAVELYLIYLVGWGSGAVLAALWPALAPLMLITGIVYFMRWVSWSRKYGWWSFGPTLIKAEFRRS